MLGSAITGGILALDIATVTGFAYAPAEAVAAWPALGALEDFVFASPPFDKIVWGHQRFGTPGCDPGLMVHEAHFWFTAQFHSKERPARLVAIEAPLPLAHMTKAVGPMCPRCRQVPQQPLLTTDVQRKLGDLYGVLDLVRFRAPVRCVEHNVKSIRAHFLADGGAKKREGAVIRRCLERGWEVGTDDDAADALAVLDYAVAFERGLVKKTEHAGAAIERAAAAAEQDGAAA